MNDGGKWPTNANASIRALLMAMQTPRPFWERVRLWMRSPLSWQATKMRGTSLHSLSTAVYPEWRGLGDE